MNFYQIFERTTALCPDKEAVFYKNSMVTYRQLKRLVNQFHRFLKNHGVTEQTRVMFCLPNSTGFIIAFLALCKIKAKSVLFHFNDTTDEITRILNETDCSVLFADSIFLEQKCRPLIMSGRIKSTESVRFTDNEKMEVAFLRKSGVEEKTAKMIDYHDEALFQYSSGVTGVPKCIVRSHENLIYAAINFVSTVGYQKEDRIICTTPFFHAFGLNTCLLSALYSGCSLILLNNLNPLETIRYIKECQATVLTSIPYLYQFIVKFRPRRPISLKPLRCCISGGGVALSSEIADAFFDRFQIRPIQVYGSTETAEISVNSNDRDDDAQYMGKILNNVSVKIIDEKGKNTAPNIAGEICVKSPAVSPGYKNPSVADHNAFKRGWYYTGDFGTFDENGYLRLTGRRRSTISVSGKKVDPKEVENVLVSYHKINEAVVTGQKDQFYGEIVKAILVSRDTCSQLELIQFCKQYLAEYKIPRIFEFRKELPKSVTGKILLKELQN